MNVVPLKRTRPETCVSDFAMDQFLASELGKDREREVRKHLFACLECTARMEVLRKGRDAFLELAESGAHLALVRSAPSPLQTRSSLPWKGIAIAAGVALVGVMMSIPLREETGTRTKGSAAKLGF